MYYLSIRNVFLANSKLKTINSLGITFITIIIVGVLKFTLESHIFELGGFEPLYLEVFVILIAIIVYISKKIKAYNQKKGNEK